MKRQRLFGTDGIRGRYGDGWLSRDGGSAVGRAIGAVLARRDGRSSGRALLGHDGRRSGPELEAAVARGLRASGHEVESAGLTTTPGLALLGRVQDFDVTVMISASHNPAGDNGIKVFGPSGSKLDDGVEDLIEEELHAFPDPIEDDRTLEHDPTLEETYLEHLMAAAEGMNLAGTVIVLDCANGGGSRIAPRILGRLGAQVLPIACDPDGDNINQSCGSTQPASMQEAVRLHGADLGIALDGDGDRCILCDAQGNLVNGDGILTLIGRDAAEQGKLPQSKLVATVMSNKGLHRALRDKGVAVHTVGVGDRQVVEALRQESLGLGGEQSGHIVFGSDNHYIGDGTYTALRVLSVMRRANRSLAELAAPYVPFPQVLINVPVQQKPHLDEVQSLAQGVRSIESELGDDGRVLLRYSGTEPLARVMVEGPDEDRIRVLAQGLADAVSDALGG